MYAYLDALDALAKGHLSVIVPIDGGVSMWRSRLPLWLSPEQAAAEHPLAEVRAAFAFGLCRGLHDRVAGRAPRR